MKATTILMLCVFTGLGATVNADDGGKDHGVSFALQFDCTDAERKGWCLEGWFEPELSVVVLDKEKTLCARTGDSFTAERYRHWTYPQDDPFKGTQLVETDRCQAEGDSMPQPGYLRLAVVGANPAEVRPITRKDDSAQISTMIESEARRLAESPLPDQRLDRAAISGEGLVDACPVTIKVRKVVLLIFQLRVFPYSSPENGPAVILIDNKLFRLSGSCIGTPSFFTVNDKLHMVYSESSCCWRCGDSSLRVCDISAGKPKQVFSESTAID